MKTRRDQGWAWVVLAGGFLAYTLVFGIVASNGVVYSGLLDVFGDTYSATAWVTFTMQSCMNIFSPLAGFVGRKISYRFAVMAGGMISCFGLVLSFLVSSMGSLYVTYGLILGFGLSFTIAPTAVIIGLYFERHRALANGICFAGSGVGAFVIPPLVNWLKTEYGLRGAFLCIGGIALNIVVCASVFRRQPPIEPKEAPIKLRSRDENLEDDTVKITVHINASEELITEKPPAITMRELNRNTQTEKKKEAEKGDATDSLLPTVKIIEDPCLDANASCWNTCQASDAGYFTNGMFLLVAFGWSVTMLSLASCVLIAPDFASRELQTVSRADATFLISAVAAGDISGRLAFGWFIDLRLFPNKFLCMVSLCLAGLVLMLTSQATTYPALIACCVAYGLTAGCCISIHPLLLVDYLGLRGFQRSFGYLGFIAGIIMLTLSPLVGILRDMTGSYQSSLCLVGGLVFFAGSLWVTESLIVRCQPLPKDAEILKTKRRFCNMT